MNLQNQMMYVLIQTTCTVLFVLDLLTSALYFLAGLFTKFGEPFIVFSVYLVQVNVRVLLLQICNDLETKNWSVARICVHATFPRWLIVRDQLVG